MKFTSLMCWRIGKSSGGVLYGKLYSYGKLAIKVIVEDSKGEICSYDIP